MPGAIRCRFDGSPTKRWFEPVAETATVLGSYTDARARFALAAALMIAQIDDALAHGFAGERFFPATILTDDPFVADEISLPQVSLNPPGADDSQLTNIEIDLSKRITPNLGFTIGDEWQRLRSPGVPSVGGLGPLRTGVQYQLFIDGPARCWVCWGSA